MKLLEVGVDKESASIPQCLCARQKEAPQEVEGLFLSYSATTAKVTLGTCISLGASASFTIYIKKKDDTKIPAVHTNAAFPLTCHPGNKDQNSNKLGDVMLLLSGMMIGQTPANFLKCA